MGGREMSQGKGGTNRTMSHEIDERFHQLLDALPVAAYTCDGDGLITYFNEAAVRIWGRRPKLNDPLDRFCGSFKLLAADGSPIRHDECWMALALRSGQGYNRQEIVIERADGSLVRALAHANPIHNEAGKLVGAVNILVDASEQQLAEKASAFLGAIVESSEDAIISKTLEGKILTWNTGAQRLFGYTAEEAIGRPITMLIPKERHTEEETILSRLRRGERIEHFETVRVAKNGREIDISLSVSPVRDHTGKIVAAAKVARDITAQKCIEVALREADRRKDEFMAILAHELRNPLAPISNSLHILRLSGELSPAMEQIRGIMERQVQQLVRLVDDLLEASRIKRDKLELRKDRVELAAVLWSAIETSRPLIDAAGHQLAIAMPADTVLLDADPVRIAQVVSNLLNNAAKYTPDGGQIWLTAKTESGEAVISVRDTGIGIPPAALTKVFDMYAQADESLERSQGGLGIGLTLAKYLVELHGGRIEAESAGVGKGSEFIVHLPLAVTSPRAPVASLTSQRTLTPKRILIADDRRDAVFVLGKLLEKMGQHVQIVHSAAAALELALAEPPDVLISDIAMPGMDGYELAQRVRQEPVFRDVVLVALSGYGNLEDRERAKRAGFDFHLIKPVSWDALERLLALLPAPQREAEVDG